MDPTANTPAMPHDDSFSVPPPAFQQADSQTSQSNGAFQTAATPQTTTTPDGAPPVSGDGTPATTTTSDSGGGKKGGGARRSVIMISIFVVFILAGIASATLLLRQPTSEDTFAWDCALYQFEVTQDGTVIVQNGSNRDLPAQVATVYIDGEKIREFDVPALSSSNAATLGTVPVPEDGRFDWEVTGSKDCQNADTFEPESQARCLDVLAFDENWDPLAIQDLAALEAGDVVRFTVRGNTTQGVFEAARFTINGELQEEVTLRRPGTEDFYIEYEIPEETAEFSINAELKHSIAGWI